MTHHPFSYYLKDFGPAAGLFVAYFIVGSIGLSIHPVSTFAPLALSAAGIGLAALVLYGYRLWPAILIAAFAVNLSAGAGSMVALGIALGNTLECLAGAYFLKRYVGFNPAIARLHDNMGLIATAFVGSAIGATAGVASVWFGGALTLSELGTTWGAWWIGDALSILIIAPLLYKWLSPPITQRTPVQYLEMGILIAVVLATSILIFWTPTRLVYALFVPLVWSALRTGPRGTTAAVFVAAAVAISGTLAGYGPYTSEGLFHAQIFLATVAALFLMLTVIVEERRRTQTTMGRHVDELEHALHKVSSEDEAKKDFLAILSHELRNPLSAILSSVELLRLKEVHTPDTSQLLQTIDEHVHAMTSMLDDLLDVARISRNKLTLRKETLSLDSLIDRCVRTAQVIIRSRGHTFSVIKPEHELFIEADPIRLEQILVNLLNNAAKYTNPNGSIELIARREGGMAVIRVRDSGIGIRKDMLKRIFEPFFQIERGKLVTEGLGVGLPLARQLVEMHQGSIEATSPGEGRGSEFIVRLPLPANIQSPRVVKPNPHIGRQLRRAKHARTILVVDDNEVAAEALGRLLELRGHEVTIAHNGREARDKALQLRPQIIILDIGLPDIDGYEVVRLLREEKDFSPTFIALTGYGQESDKERARDAGFNFHLTKPVGLKDIEAVFQKIPASPASLSLR